MAKEIWYKIERLEGYYMSNMCRIKSIPKHGNHHIETILKKTLSYEGYEVVSVYKNGKRSQERVHRLFAELFIPNPDNKPFINHKNGIKNDNRIENLEWCTAKGNAEHASRTNLLKPCRGEKHGGSRRIGKFHKGKLSKTYECIKYVSNDGFNYPGVRQAVTTGHRTGGFHWKYLDEKTA